MAGEPGAESDSLGRHAGASWLGKSGEGGWAGHGGGLAAGHARIL